MLFVVLYANAAFKAKLPAPLEEYWQQTHNINMEPDPPVPLEGLHCKHSALESDGYNLMKIFCSTAPAVTHCAVFYEDESDRLGLATEANAVN